MESWEQGNPVKKGLGVSERTPVKKEVIHLMEQIGDINIKILSDNSIVDYSNIFISINILKLIVVIFILLFPNKKNWAEFAICIYGGFLVGLIPAFYIFESLSCMLVGSFTIGGAGVFLQRYFKSKTMLPTTIVLIKILLIIVVTIGEERFFNNFWSVYPLLVFVPFLFVFLFKYFFDSMKQVHFLYEFFAIMELCGCLIQLYRSDYSYFNKYLDETMGVVEFILYLLRIDFWIFDFQYLFLTLIVIFWGMYIVFRKMLYEKVWKSESR